VSESHYQNFPGPKPYEEHQHYLFFGRDRDVEDMLNKTRERLGVLSAESGAGKSSLLEAGYVPRLRMQRAARRGVPPVLLLRSWGGRALEPDDRILEGTKQAIDGLVKRSSDWTDLADRLASSNDPRSAEAAAIARFLAEDHHRLSITLARETNKTPAPKAFEVLEALAEADGLILILDQFEEFMGSASAEAGGDWTPAEQATHAVGRLFRDVPKVRIIISLRTEYCQRLLRDLNKFVVNLQSRVINLLPLPPASILQIVEGVSGRSGPDVEKFAFKLATASRAGDGDGDNPAERREDLYSLGYISVLEMQALLLGFEKWCEKTKQVMDFTTSQWQGYVESLGVKPPTRSMTVPRRYDESRSTELNLGRRALGRWVTDQLEMAVCNASGDVDPGGQRSRWLLLPVLPRLSTHGGYKQHLPLRQLVLDLADRLSYGLGQRDNVKQRVKAWMDNDRKDVLQLELGAEGGDGAVRSAAAPLEDDVDVVQCITDFLRTIDELDKARLLKLSGNGADLSCELIHDGLSEHVRKWADDLPNNPETTLGCPVKVIGESFGWRELGEDGQGERRLIERKKWIGCTLNATIRNIKFKNCEFRGLAFKGCTLENVVFEDCEMSGAITIGGSWTATEFRECTLMSALFREVSFGSKTEFRGFLPKLDVDGVLGKCDEGKQSDMRGIQFVECEMLPDSKMEFTECLLRFSMIGSIKNNSEKGWRFARCDIMNAWIEDAGMPSVEVDQYCRTIGLLSFKLPQPAWLDRRQS
jgi:hypothetical protein